MKDNSLSAYCDLNKFSYYVTVLVTVPLFIHDTGGKQYMERVVECTKSKQGHQKILASIILSSILFTWCETIA
jgi:hypothetical protein